MLQTQKTCPHRPRRTPPVADLFLVRRITHWFCNHKSMSDPKYIKVVAVVSPLHSAPTGPYRMLVELAEEDTASPLSESIALLVVRILEAKGFYRRGDAVSVDPYLAEPEFQAAALREVPQSNARHKIWFVPAI